MPRQFTGKRVILVPGSLELGGTERQAIYLAKYLQERENASVRIIGFSEPGRAAQLCDELGVPWKTIPIRWGKTRLTRWASAALHLAAALRRERPDVLLPYLAFPNILCGLIWRLTGAKACVWNQRDEGFNLDRRIAYWAVRNTPVFVANSSAGREILVQRFRVRRDSVQVVHNGVAMPPVEGGRSAWRERLKLSDDCFVACMLANITKLKDHATLLHAWRLVVDQLHAAGRSGTLLLAGRLDDATPMKALAFDLELGQSVRFLGPVADVAGLLSSVDLAVFSSRAEGCPNGVLECMASGLAVVASDILGVREAVGPDGAALLSEPGNAESMAQSIIRLAFDPALRTALGHVGRNRIKSCFSVDQMGAAMTTIIADALAGRCRNRHQ